MALFQTLVSALVVYIGSCIHDDTFRVDFSGAGLFSSFRAVLQQTL